MAEAQVGVRFIENSRGGRTLIHNQYMFRLKTRKNDRSYWNCILSTCPARLNTNNDQVTKATENHNHEQDAPAVGAAAIMSQVRKRCRESVESLPSLYDDATGSLRSPEWNDDTRAVVEKLPTFYGAKSALYRQRAKLHPKLPKTIEDVNLEDQWTETTAGEPFLLVDDGDREKILIFATDSNLHELAASDVWYMDGTFYASPGYFTQVYTIHCLIDSFMVPLVYGLLPNKTQATYTRFFRLLKETARQRHIHLEPDHAMLDFEIAARNALKAVFLLVEVKACFFHFAQAIWRKVQSCGLAGRFSSDDDLKTLVRRAAVLPLVPLESVEDVWLHALEDNDDDSAAVLRFKDYVTETWVEGDKRLWNHFQTEGPRTTNHVEGWHHKLNSKLKHSHPSIYTILNVFKQEQAANEVKLIQHAAGGARRPRKRVYRELEQRLQRLKSDLSESVINVSQYADAASYLIKLGV